MGRAGQPVTASAGVAHAGRRFRYRAIDARGVTVRGTMDGTDADAVSETLRRQGLLPVAIHAPVVPVTLRSIPARDLGIGLRILGGLLDAGLPMARALAAFATLAPATWSGRTAALEERIRSGSGLAHALAEGGDIPPVLVGIISAGEASGRLGDAVRRAADVAEEGAALRTAIRGALVYPTILLVAGGASVALLVAVVLPRFATILADLGQDPPAMTQLVLHATQALQAAWRSAALVLVAAFVAWRWWLTTEDGRTAWSRFTLALPVLGGVRRAAATARVCVSMAALLESGVPIAHALAHATSAAGEADTSQRLAVARQSVIEGAPLGRALAVAGALTESALRLIAAGEESGRLATMCEHAGRLEGERARELTRSAVRLLEPALILLFGGLVAIVAAALLQAVYTVRPVGA